MKKAIIIALALVAVSTMAQAAMTVSRGSSFSSSRSSMSYRAPSVPSKPAVPPARPVIVQKNVTVQQNVSHVTQSTSSGGGFFTTMFGTVAGVGIGNWLFGHKEQPPAFDCSAEKNQSLQICQPVKQQ